METSINTRILVLSDTHAATMSLENLGQFDVAIHCGDLTDGSKLTEFEQALSTLKTIKAPLKIVIAGNHDFSMDIPTFSQKLASMQPPLEHTDPLVQATYGSFGQAKALFTCEDAKASGICFVDEGNHELVLKNGATLRIYASPYTPGVNEWGFQFNPNSDHDWKIENADIAITHGPPRGILDKTESKKRGGDPHLFAAIARSQPRVHCFGHLHEAWGAKRVTWRNTVSESPSHFTDIDNDESELIEDLATIHPTKSDSESEIQEKKAKFEVLRQQGFCTAEAPGLGTTGQTLFVNAAVESIQDESMQLPWVIELDLPVKSTP